MKKYPIQYKSKGEYIPFEMMLEHEEQCLINHGQSVETLARRCGTDYLETYYILNDSKYKSHNKANYDVLTENARMFVQARAYEWLMKNNKLSVS